MGDSVKAAYEVQEELDNQISYNSLIQKIRALSPSEFGYIRERYFSLKRQAYDFRLSKLEHKQLEEFFLQLDKILS